MAMTYKPVEGSVPFKVIEWFKNNPDEALSSGDIAVKFDKPQRQVHSFLALAIEAGVLTRETDSDLELIYRLGNDVPATKPERTRAHVSLRETMHAPSTPRKALDIDIDSIRIDKGVPMPQGRSKVIDWSALLARMSVGDSCLLPKRARTQITKVCTQAKRDAGRIFSLRAIDEAQIRVWRLPDLP